MAYKYYVTANFTHTTGQYNGMAPKLFTPTLVRLTEGRSLDRWLTANSGNYTEKTESQAKTLFTTYIQDLHSEENRTPEMGDETSTMTALSNIDNLWV